MLNLKTIKPKTNKSDKYSIQRHKEGKHLYEIWVKRNDAWEEIANADTLKEAKESLKFFKKKIKEWENIEIREIMNDTR